MRQNYFLFCVMFLGIAVIFDVAAQNTTQIGRYSTVVNQPSKAQTNPLLAVSEFHFPPSVKTVGEAVEIVLESTGYRLADKNQLSESMRQTLRKPLPLTDRQLGPLSAKETLLVLMGKEVYTLVYDPLHRIVNFNIKSNIANALGVKHGRHQNCYS